MQTIEEQRLNQILSGIGKNQILVLGDVMLDEYIWGNVSRISPEAPVPVVEVSQETYKLGGAANVAFNIKTLGDWPLLAGVVGKDKNGEKLQKKMKELDICPDGIIFDENRQTTVKTRLVAHNQQVVRIDREDAGEISEETVLKLMDFIKSKISQIKALIISDYGKGVITYSILNEVINLALNNKLFVFVYPKETHFFSYKKVSLITPNHIEAGFVWGKKIKNDQILEEVGWGLLDKLEAESVLITRGEKGMSLFEKNKSLTHFPTVAKEIYDVTGAGDTVISSFVSAYAAGASLKEAALISNHAAGIVVAELGTASVTRKELYQDLKDFT